MAKPDGMTENERRLMLMLRFQLTRATWNEAGDIVSADRLPGMPAVAAVPAPAQQATPATPKPTEPTGLEAMRAKLLSARAARDHEIRFAHSHFKPPMPRVEAPPNAVPRAVRAREAARGDSSKRTKSKR